MENRKPSQVNFLIGTGCYCIGLTVLIISISSCNLTSSKPIERVGSSVVTRSGFASWYSYETCTNQGKFGDKCVTANGERFDDSKFTAASWDFPFGTKLLITNVINQKHIVVEVTDRWPAKEIYNRGCILDLSRAAFNFIADLDDGVIAVKAEVMDDQS